MAEKKASQKPEKLDLKKQLKEFYTASAKTPAIIDVPAANYLMLDGAGDPSSTPAFEQSFEALFPVAYTIKFSIKLSGGRDFTVMAPEGLWWADDMSAFCEDRKDEWKWTLMIMQPAHVTSDIFRNAVKQVKEKKNPVLLPYVRFEKFKEGRCAQIMHVGPYGEIGAVTAKLLEFIGQSGLECNGKHHEIYMNDPRRAAPEKLKTIIRMPVKNKGK